MNVLMGLGGSASQLVTLGFASAPAAATSSGYVLLGTGQSTARYLALGLRPAAPATTGGSYITFGFGVSARRALLLGMGAAQREEIWLATSSANLRPRRKREDYADASEEADLFLLGML